MIRFEDVSKHYDNHTALRKVSFSVEKGEMVFITGPSGSGKSTLLKLIYLSERADEGSVFVSGWEINSMSLC
jgi:cell division transport system ATP-binding protein